MAKITGTLKNGFGYEIDDTVFHSMRFVDALAAAGAGDIAKFSEVIKMLFGEEQREALYCHIEGCGEEPTIEMMDAIITEIGDNIPQGKN